MATIYDNHGRPLNYLRLAVTDRCNLRCFYCMPEKGITYLPKKEVLSFEEMIRLITIFASLGVTKIRLTGGEPFLRRDLLKLISTMVEIPGIKEWHITTNGVLTSPYVGDLKRLGVGSVNLSLDTLDKSRFQMITRRDEFDQCFETLAKLLDAEIPVKLNVVVMDGKNIDDLIPMAELTKNKAISVRFIEEMPFNGSGELHPTWTYTKIIAHLTEHFGPLEKLSDPSNSTAYHYRIPGYHGNIGVIAAFSRTFCGTCNRLRVTPQGMLKTCLYDNGALDLKSLIRSDVSDNDVKSHLLRAFSNRALNGFEAEEHAHRVHDSMSTIGG